MRKEQEQETMIDEQTESDSQQNGQESEEVTRDPSLSLVRAEDEVRLPSAPLAGLYESRRKSGQLFP